MGACGRRGSVISFWLDGPRCVIYIFAGAGALVGLLALVGMAWQMAGFSTGAAVYVEESDGLNRFIPGDIFRFHGSRQAVLIHPGGSGPQPIFELMAQAGSQYICPGAGALVGLLACVVVACQVGWVVNGGGIIFRGPGRAE